ncbi:MAG: hypothetical protein V7641_539, partial [Blastocatellia bacterium]
MKAEGMAVSPLTPQPCVCTAVLLLLMIHQTPLAGRQIATS